MILELGQVATTLEVTDAGVLIDTTTAQVGSSYQAREVIELPSASAPLGVLNLSLLGAGIASSGGIGLGDGPAVGGQRPRNNNYNVEGVDNNRKDVTGHNIDVPNEAVAEFSDLAEPVLRGVWQRQRRAIQHGVAKRRQPDPRLRLGVLSKPQAQRGGPDLGTCGDLEAIPVTIRIPWADRLEARS